MKQKIRVLGIVCTVLSCLLWLSLAWNIMKWDPICTPSEDTQQSLQAISCSQLSMEILVTEVWLTDARCYFDDNTWYWWTNIPCPSKEELSK